MSLTRMIDKRQGPVWKFIDAHFDVDPFIDDLLKSLTGLNMEPVLPPPRADYPWALVGTAFDYRVRFEFPPQPTDFLVAERGIAHLSAQTDQPKQQMMAEFLARTYQVRTAWLSSERANADRYAVGLAVFDRVYRDGGLTSSLDPLILTLLKAMDVDTFLSIIPADVEKDVERLVNGFIACCPNLLDRESFPNPTFALSRKVGGADADLLLGPTLIEFKTYRRTPARESIRSWLAQLLGYALLDTDDAFHIRSIALYLSRQSLYREWSLQEVLGCSSRMLSRNLARHRASFAALTNR